jgi:peptidoglycan/LPS O-acetylase OafA/YrhL
VQRATPGGIAYQPALDGLRALAVASVIAYHLGYGWARGGYLGVDTFFVLSGFLITSLLLAEFSRAGRIDLRSFWARRARRLLPALFLVLAAIAAYAAWWAPAQERRQLRGDGLAALLYSANWRFILAHNSYFDLFAAPSLVEHTWSLAIEEQFYLVWPLVVVACLAVGRGGRAPLVAFATVGVTTSAVLMARLADSDPTRAYFGSDTRVHSLLVGTLLAMLLERRRLSASGAPARLISGIGALALLAIAAAYATIGDNDLRMYRGGFLLFAVGVAIVITAAVQPRGPVRALLSLRPLVWIGTISYGLYLWHWPVLLVLTPSRTHLTGLALDATRIAVTVGCATASFYVLELPIRRGKRLRAAIAVPSATVIAGSVAAALVMATAGPSPALAFATPVSTASVTLSTVATPNPISSTAASPPDRSPPTSAEVPPPPQVIGIVGDSVAASLIPGLEAAAGRRGVAVAGAAIPGCGATDAFSLDDDGNAFSWSDDCVTAVPEVQQQLITELRPDVVLWLSSWETSDRLVAGERVRFGTPEGDAATLQGMRATLDRVTAGGARLVMLTLPPRGERMDGRPVPERREAIDHLDALIVEFAFANADRVQLIDFANIVCHGGPPCPTEVEGMWLRPDGMHFTKDTAEWAAERVLTILLATRT